MHLLEDPTVSGGPDPPTRRGLDVFVVVERRAAQGDVVLADDHLVFEFPDSGGGAVAVEGDLGVVAGMARKEGL